MSDINSDIEDSLYQNESDSNEGLDSNNDDESNYVSDLMKLQSIHI